MATKEIANTMGAGISEFGRTTGRRASITGQHMLDRMLRATGSGASSAGGSIESALSSTADALPINKEHSSNTMKFVLGTGGIALIGAGIMYGPRLVNRFRSGMSEEQAMNDKSLTDLPIAPDVEAATFPPESVTSRDTAEAAAGIRSQASTGPESGPGPTI